MKSRSGSNTRIQNSGNVIEMDGSGKAYKKQRKEKKGGYKWKLGSWNVLEGPKLELLKMSPLTNFVHNSLSGFSKVSLRFIRDTIAYSEVRQFQNRPVAHRTQQNGDNLMTQTGTYIGCFWIF